MLKVISCSVHQEKIHQKIYLHSTSTVHRSTSTRPGVKHQWWKERWWTGRRMRRGWQWLRSDMTERSPLEFVSAHITNFRHWILVRHRQIQDVCANARWRPAAIDSCNYNVKRLVIWLAHCRWALHFTQHRVKSVNAQRHNWPSYLCRESHTPSNIIIALHVAHLETVFFAGLSSTLYPNTESVDSFSYFHIQTTNTVSIALFRTTRLSVGGIRWLMNIRSAGSKLQRSPRLNNPLTRAERGRKIALESPLRSDVRVEWIGWLFAATLPHTPYLQNC